MSQHGHQETAGPNPSFGLPDHYSHQAARFPQSLSHSVFPTPNHSTFNSSPAQSNNIELSSHHVAQYRNGESHDVQGFPFATTPRPMHPGIDRGAVPHPPAQFPIPKVSNVHRASVPTSQPHSPMNQHVQVQKFSGNVGLPTSGTLPPTTKSLHATNHHHPPSAGACNFPPAVSNPPMIGPVRALNTYDTIPQTYPRAPTIANPTGVLGSNIQPRFNVSRTMYHTPASEGGWNSPSTKGVPPMPLNNWQWTSGSHVENKNKPIDLKQEKLHILEWKHALEPLSFSETLENHFLTPPNQKNCSPEVFRCTLNAIPNSKGLLDKVKLPLGLIIHPFKDLESLPVISAGNIVRCKRCRAYINPFVEFMDERRWRCNMCFVVNDVSEEFLHHPITKSYGEPHTRPECTNATIEFIAPQEYMVRPPQPAVYMFLFDVSHGALDTGYFKIVCKRLLEKLDSLPGDRRTKIGFITYDGNLHFYKLVDGASQPEMLVVSDIDDVFLPTPDYLLVNLHETKDLVCDLLRELPSMHFASNIVRGECETKSCLGSALQAALKLMSAYGGRITVFQQSLPNVGGGAITSREDPNVRAKSASTASINPSTDFYKKIALELSGKQIAADFFFLNSQYIDISTLCCTSRFSAGDLHYYPNLHVTHNPLQVKRLIHDFDRYLTRKIGFEAVMRVRCTKGLAITAFHGSFFVRSTDLLALANINPDAGFGINLNIEDDISSLAFISIQAALLYTSSRGERRIRVHTMKFPIVKSAIDVFNAVDSDAVVAILSKMAVDRSIASSLTDAKDALLNAVIDALKSYRDCSSHGNVTSAILVPPCLKSYPLAISFLLKHPAFRSGVSTRLDDRVFSMMEFKSQPIGYILRTIHPYLYRVDNLMEQGSADFGGNIVPQPTQLPLSAESVSSIGVYLMDTGWNLYLYVSANSNRDFIHDVFGVKQFSNIKQPMYVLPDLNNHTSEMLNSFLDWLREQRPYYAALQVIRSDSRERLLFMNNLRLDKSESAMSYQEYLQNIEQQLTK